MRVAGALFDMASMARAYANGELPPIPYMPSFVIWHFDEMMEEIKEDTKKIFYNNMRKAISEGMKEIELFLEEKKNYQKKSKWDFSLSLYQNMPCIAY